MFAIQLREILKQLNSRTATTGDVKKEVLLYVDDTEIGRLVTQAKNTAVPLKEICDSCAVQLRRQGRSNLKVLDVGCANGELGRQCFKSSVYSKVYGIDCNKELIQVAEQSVRDTPEQSKYTYKVFNIEKVEKSTKELLKSLGYEQIEFDIIFCSMVLHHLKKGVCEHDPKYVQVINILQNFKKLLAPGGFLIVNNPDDSSKLSYEDDCEFDEKQGITNNTPNNIKSTLGELVQLTSRIPGVSDRYCGRATYYWLANAGFKNMRVFTDR